MTIATTQIIIKTTIATTKNHNISKTNMREKENVRDKNSKMTEGRERETNPSIRNGTLKQTVVRKN